MEVTDMTRAEMTTMIRRIARHNKNVPVTIDKRLDLVVVGEGDREYVFRDSEAREFLVEMEIMVQRFKINIYEAIRYTQTQW
jgi:hypothetical protein